MIGKLALLVALLALGIAAAALTVALTRDPGPAGPACTARSVYLCP